MKVVTNISKRDLLAFNLQLLPRMKSTYVTILVIALLAFALICYKNGLPHTPKAWGLMTLSSLAGGLIGMLIGFGINLVLIVSMSSTDNGVLGVHEYTLSTEGLFEKTSANETLNKWEGISSIKVFGPYALYQISGYLFHIIPSNSFANQELFSEYVSESRAYWEQAHNNQRQGDA